MLIDKVIQISCARASFISRGDESIDHPTLPKPGGNIPPIPPPRIDAHDGNQLGHYASSIVKIAVNCVCYPFMQQQKPLSLPRTVMVQLMI